ncbi:hypothetical protein [Aquimarina muelleri]|uniref:Antibiotic biosynthesis monooxygenase n=1 Tax=Aquimarina muelleri TaxID=279356 RepID=A0A918JQT3_9FLAO|nr:hypothetical protein [Aquimarina muelleri]MCX2763052.1 hypothetical protein [Aquimarina muelleri]GGX03153.1 hypothetical protein GCM10007384_01120 [Aquimarina muelleri]
MINLLFDCVKEPNQNLILTNNKPKVVEVVLFEINPGYTEKDAKKALSSLNDIVKLYYGFVERITAKNENGKYMDIIYWRDINSAKSAAADLAQNEKATIAFSVIKSQSVQMYYFDMFNQFEE